MQPELLCLDEWEAGQRREGQTGLCCCGTRVAVRPCSADLLVTTLVVHTALKMMEIPDQGKVAMLAKSSW